MIRKYLYKFMVWINRYGSNMADHKAEQAVMKSSTRLEAQGRMTFTVFPASGGKVIQMTSYQYANNGKHNSIGPEEKTSLYLVPDGENLAEELALIMTRHSLSM